MLDATPWRSAWVADLKGGWPETFADLVEEIRRLSGEEAARDVLELMRWIGYELEEAFRRASSERFRQRLRSQETAALFHFADCEEPTTLLGNVGAGKRPRYSSMVGG